MSFEKNKNLDNLINVVNNLLHPIEVEQMEGSLLSEESDSLPIMLLLGAPRSGSTLFTQWAATTGAFAYPSNFLSRFYKAPYVGALIYKMVTDPAYQYRDEFSDINQELIFSSSIGKTNGFKAPHEFWYFWRRFLEFPDVPCTEEEFASKFDFYTFGKEISLIKKAFGKPFLFKAHILNWYARSISRHTENVLFIHLYRNPVSTTRSLLKARETWTGNRENWFSFKPREYEILRKMDVYHQIAGQIYFIDKEILTKKKMLGPRYISFSYEEFCENPSLIYHKLAERIKELTTNYRISEYSGGKSFEVSNPASLEDKRIKDAYVYFENQFGVLKF